MCIPLTQVKFTFYNCFSCNYKIYQEGYLLSMENNHENMRVSFTVAYMLNYNRKWKTDRTLWLEKETESINRSWNKEIDVKCEVAG